MEDGWDVNKYSVIGLISTEFWGQVVSVLVQVVLVHLISGRDTIHGFLFIIEGYLLIRDKSHGINFKASE